MIDQKHYMNIKNLSKLEYPQLTSWIIIKFAT